MLPFEVTDFQCGQINEADTRTTLSYVELTLDRGKTTGKPSSLLPEG
jgi:hypothetical protein